MQKNNITHVVELKTSGIDENGAENLPKVAEALKKYDLQDKTIISSWKLLWIREMHDYHLMGADTLYCVSITVQDLETRYTDIETKDGISGKMERESGMRIKIISLFLQTIQCFMCNGSVCDITKYFSLFSTYIH